MLSRRWCLSHRDQGARTPEQLANARKSRATSQSRVALMHPHGADRHTLAVAQPRADAGVEHAAQPKVAAQAEREPHVVGDGAAGEHVHRRLRSEEHTSELQSQSNLVCRLLLEKKK